MMAMRISPQAWRAWARCGSPDYMAAPHVAAGELVRLFPEWRIDAMPLHLAFPPNRHVSAKLRVFIDWIAALVEQRMPRARP